MNLPAKPKRKPFQRKVYLFLKVLAPTADNPNGEVKVVESFTSGRDAFDFMHASPENKTLTLYVHEL